MTNLSGQFNWMSLRGVRERCFKFITWLEYLSKLNRLTSGLTVTGKALFLIYTKETLESTAWQWGRHKPSHLIRKHILVSVFLGISNALSTRRCKLLQKTMTDSYLDKNYTKLGQSGGGEWNKNNYSFRPCWIRAWLKPISPFRSLPHRTQRGLIEWMETFGIRFFMGNLKTQIAVTHLQFHVAGISKFSKAFIV